MLNTITILTLLICALFNANAQNYEWAKQAGVNGTDRGYSVATDNAGNVYVTGMYEWGGERVFFAKYDAAGNILWNYNIGNSSGWNAGRKIFLDNKGNIYITGNFTGTTNFDVKNFSAAGWLNEVGMDGFKDVFFAKYDTGANFKWAKSIGSEMNEDIGWCITADEQGNVYVGGYFRDSADFNPGVDTVKLYTSTSSTDIFLAKYDSLGNYIWAKSAGGDDNDAPFDMVLDKEGNILMTGQMGGLVDFDMDGGTASLLSNGLFDIFFAKYDSAGNYLWAHNIGSATVDIGHDIATDTAGNVYITGEFTPGYFNEPVDFDPGPDSAFLPVNGIFDIFFAKYDENGNYLWAKNLGSANTDVGKGIALDANGNIYLTGLFQDTVDFDPGADTANLIAKGSYDLFFTKYDASGSYIWAKAIGSAGDDRGNSITVDAGGNVYVTGLFNGTVDFDPGTNVANLSSLGGDELFIAKYTCYTTSSMNASACKFYISPSGNNTWTSSGTYKDTLGNAAGCDSIITVNLTITPPYLINLDTILNYGDSIQIGTNIYYTTGIYKDTLTAYNGCDSIVTTNLTVLTGISQLQIANCKLQIVPNPFSHQTQITYSLSKESEIKIELYNLLGQKIKTIADEKQGGGEHRYLLDLEKKNSEIYFLKIKMDNEILVKKIVSVQ